jgi:hypothetical protein
MQQGAKSCALEPYILQELENSGRQNYEKLFQRNGSYYKV